MTKRTIKMITWISPDEDHRFRAAAEELSLNRPQFARAAMAEKANGIGVERPTETV